MSYSNNLYHQLKISGAGPIFGPKLNHEQYRIDQPVTYSPYGLQTAVSSNSHIPQRSVVSTNAIDLPVDPSSALPAPFYVVRDHVPLEYTHIILPEDNPYFWMVYTKLFLASVSNPRVGIPLLLWWLRNYNIPAMLELMYHVIQKRENITIHKNVYKLFPLPASTINASETRANLDYEKEARPPKTAYQEFEDWARNAYGQYNRGKDAFEAFKHFREAGYAGVNLVNAVRGYAERGVVWDGGLTGQAANGEVTWAESAIHFGASMIQDVAYHGPGSAEWFARASSARDVGGQFINTEDYNRHMNAMARRYEEARVQAIQERDWFTAQENPYNMFANATSPMGGVNNTSAGILRDPMGIPASGNADGGRTQKIGRGKGDGWSWQKKAAVAGGVLLAGIGAYYGVKHIKGLMTVGAAAVGGVAEAVSGAEIAADAGDVLFDAGDYPMLDNLDAAPGPVPGRIRSLHLSSTALLMGILNLLRHVWKHSKR